MRHATYIVILSLLIFTCCRGQVKQTEATGVVNKTDELLKNKAAWTSLKDNESIDGYTRIGDAIFGGEIGCNIPPLDGIDIQTFQVYPGTKYARDKNHIYFPLNILCVDYTDCGVCYYAEIIVKGANPSTFQYLGKEYATDGRHAYFRGQLIEGADGSTFKVMDGPEYFYFATDKNAVYKHDKIFEEADPSTFHYKKNDSGNQVSESDNKYIIGDKNTEWEYIPPDQIKKIP